MDDSAFDQLSRAVGAYGSRRRLLRSVSALGLGGVLSTIGARDSAAEKPKDRLSRRTRQHRRKRRNEKRRKRNAHNGGGRGGVGADQCVATGGDCTQDSDCCTSNCFNFACAALVHQCSAGSTTNPCRPPAKGCAGDQCCHGALSCNDGCCSGDANQCNPEGNCCVPNCAGRQCGDDGCGEGGTCGSCPGGSTCNATTGQCTRPCDVCPTCTFTTIQDAVEDAFGPTTIRICPGTYNESITIRRPVTLIGAGQGNSAADTILLGAGGSVLTNFAQEGQVQIQNLRITGGDAGATGVGGGVAQGAGELVMTGCTITGNKAQIGAGIYVGHRLPLTLNQCTISLNHADYPDGLGGGIYAGTGNTTLIGCTVAANTALGTDGVGGGIAVYVDGVVQLDSTAVADNKATMDGGGIYNDGGTVHLGDGSSVAGNTPNNCSLGVSGCTN
ncbi:MAG: hypothetical protein U0Z70_00490 [Thermomicrobiales bacterium]